MGGTTPSKNQGGCGSCWAFAAVGALESVYKIANGSEQLFSEQQCLSCNDGGDGCGGGNSSTCYTLWSTVGAVSQSCMPYHGSDSYPCTQDECVMPARIDGYTYVSNNLTSLKTALLTSPIAVAIYASGGFFSYHSGCYGGANGPTNHMILLCGWDDNACGSGQGAWLIKNSWGASWGQSGFGWVRYGTTGIGGQGALINYTPFPAARVAYASHQVLDGGNGALDAGETAPVSVTVTNFGNGTATGVTATLRSLTPGVTAVDSVASFPDLASWASGSSIAPHFMVQAGGPLTAGAPIQFRLEVRSDQTASDVTLFQDFVAPVTVVYQNDFETAVDGWTHGDTQGTDDWRWAAPRPLQGQLDPMYAASGTKVWGMDLNEAGPDWDGFYSYDDDQYLRSPVINCADHTGVHLQFKRWLTCERSYGDVARILVNGTEVWRNVNNPHFVDATWVPVDLDIHALADGNPSVQVSFELHSNGWITFGGWNVDDVRVVATDVSPGAVASPASPGGLRLCAWPNPFGRLTGIDFSMDAAFSARVRIFDAQGRMVRTLLDRTLAGGAHRVLWTGADDAGRPLPAGNYFVRLETGGRVETARLVRIP
jgi:hypothetical protein